VSTLIGPFGILGVFSFLVVYLVSFTYPIKTSFSKIPLRILPLASDT
jgi:hypothetical protein